MSKIVLKERSQMKMYAIMILYNMIGKDKDLVTESKA